MEKLNLKDYIELLNFDDIEDESWMEDALCKGATEMFYPGTHDQKMRFKALSICHACPVQAPCLSYAIYHREEYGVWGGLSQVSRLRLLRKYSSKIFPENKSTA
jgi:WhiB family redox-sensing transcriptional regulator